MDNTRGKVLGAVLSLWLVIPAISSQTPPASATTAVTAVPVVTGRNYPAMFTVAADGRIWYSERTSGRIGVFNPADGSDSTYFQVPHVCSTSDQGLYGLAVSPQFPTTRQVFAYAMRKLADGNCYDQVLRLQGWPTATSMDVLTSDIWVGGHNGGRLLFGPDGDLYVSTGDGSSGLPTLDASKAQRASAQDVSSLKGKILRLNADGSTPAGNPFGNAVFAYGFRNVFGFDFDRSGHLWAADNGPDPDYPGDARGPGPAGGCNDELDLVVASSNYGWGPTGSCAKPPDAPMNTNLDGPNPVLPALNIEVSSGITATRFCNACGLGPDYEGRLFWGKYSYLQGQGQIHAATLSADGSSIVSDTVVYAPAGDAPLAIERGPDGTLYYSDTQAIYKLVSASGTTTTTTTASTTTTTAAPGSAVPLVTSFTPSYLRNDFSGWVGMGFTVGASPLQVRALGRYVAAGNSAAHTVKLVDATTGADVAGGAASVATAAASPGDFRYATLPAPVTLAAGHAYYLVSAEVAGGDSWYDFDTHLVMSPGATSVGAAYATPGGSWVTGGGAGNGYGPLNLLSGGSSGPTGTSSSTTTTTTAPTTTTTASTTTTTAAPGSAVPLVTSFTPSYLRNDFSGWVGMRFTVGASPLQVRALGRYVAAGNSAAHTVKLVDATTGADVAGGTVSVATAGAPSGQFRYATLPAPVTLAAGHAYYLVSAEVAGGDRWYDFDTHLVTTGAATNDGAAYAFTGGSWVVGGGAGNGYVPPNLVYS